MGEGGTNGLEGAWDGVGTRTGSLGGGGGERMGRDEVGIQMGWLGSRGKERGRWNTNRVAVVARGAVWDGGGGVGIQIGW